MVTPAGAPQLNAVPGTRRDSLAFEDRAMGSPLRLVVGLRDAGRRTRLRATAAWASVREEFDATEHAMSRFRDTSEITVLNRRAGGVAASAVSRRLVQALTLCDRAHRLTDGRFDPRVLIALERLGDHGSPVGESFDPATCVAASARRIVERTRDGAARLPAPVDLGGIGKGLALRWAATTIGRMGFDSFLLEAGADIVALGEAVEGGPWLVGIEDPEGGSEPTAVIALVDEAVTTSSIRLRRWLADDRVVHHLIDPRTGEPGGDGLLAVSVAGPDPAWAEVWSKALFLEGRAGIAALARRRGLAAWWIDDHGCIEMTAGARIRTVWQPGDAG